MRTRTLLLLLFSITATTSLTGCLERRIRITSTPPGAIVHLNDVEVGRTPVEVDFTWFGDYDVRLFKEGFDPLWTHRVAKAPLQEQPGIDIFAELIPHRFITQLDWHFDLEPENTDPDALIARAQELRSELTGATAQANTAEESDPSADMLPIESAPIESTPPDVDDFIAPPSPGQPREEMLPPLNDPNG